MKRSPLCPAPLLVGLGGEGVAFFEVPLEVALVGKPQRVRHVGQRVALPQQALGVVDALVQLEGVRCLTIGLFEAADQVVAVQA